jgi:hypothetical protein
MWRKPFSRWFRRQVDWAGLNVTAIRVVVPTDHESVLAFDPSYIPKSGKHTEGLGHFWNGYRAGGTGFGSQCVELGRCDGEHGLYD